MILLGVSLFNMYRQVLCVEFRQGSHNLTADEGSDALGGQWRHTGRAVRFLWPLCFTTGLVHCRLGKHRNEQREVKVMGSGSITRGGEETIGISDDHQRLLSPTATEHDHTQPSASPRASGASLSGSSPSMDHDASHVLLATSMENQQQRLLSPSLSGPAPPLRSVELVQRPAHQGGQTDA